MTTQAKTFSAIESSGQSALIRWAPALAAAIAALLVYGCTIHGTFVYDDIFVILSDPKMGHPALWGRFWTQPFAPTPDKPFRPLLSLSFAVQYWIWGQRGWPFHLVNILLHALASGAVAELGRRLAGVRTAWFAGLIFAVHPAHAEAVAAIVGRSELACGLATLCGLCLYLRPLTAWRIAGITGCFIVALLTKEQGMVFPFLILFQTPFRQSRGIHRGEGKQLKWLAAILCYLLAGYILFRETMIGFSWDRVFLEWVLNPLVRSQGIDRVLMPLVLIGRYGVLLVWPHRLSVDYGGTAIGWTASPHDPYLYLGILTVITYIALVATFLVRRNWAAIFCLLSLGITYGMIGNIVALIGPIFAERIIYLPSAFVLILVGMAFGRLKLWIMAPVLAILTVAAGWAAFSYARLWNYPMALFQQCVRDQPGSERVYSLLFREYVLRGDLRQARRVAGDSIAAAPESDGPYAMCIQADLAMGNVDDALAMYNRGMGACKGFEKLFLLPYGQKIEEARAASTRPAAERKTAPMTP